MQFEISYPVAVPKDGTFCLTIRSVNHYVTPVIKSFVDRRTAAIFAGYMVRDLPLRIQKRARAKLLTIDAAKRLDDLAVPPGNRLEVLHADREGQHSIRINDQWRICFVWHDGESWDVEISSTTIEEQDHDHPARGH